MTHVRFRPRPLVGLLSPGELRQAGRGAGAVLVLGLLGVALWLSPWSPGAAGHAADLAAHGDTQQAIAVYLDQSEGVAFAGARRDALWSAAWLASVDQSRPQQAIDLLRRFVGRHPDDPRVAVAYDRLASLYRVDQQDPVRAAQAWTAAAAASADPAHGAGYLLDAGLALDDAGLADRATALLARAALQATAVVPASLALGRLALASDPAAAYDHYSAALGAAEDPADASLARLGMATALEALDQVDQALAELDVAADDDQSLARRRTRLWARDQH